MLGKLVFAVLIIFVALPAAVLIIYRFVPPPVTPLMFVRAAEGEGNARRWVPLSQISPNAADAVIASEDNKFCTHFGFDLDAVRQSVEQHEEGGGLRGASTISMQVARNLFLLPVRSWVRKAAEAYLTVFLEFLLPKHRILEIYLNIAEWGRGIFGIEAASRAYFRKDAAHLSRHEAALLAAILPNPREWSANPPGEYVSERATVITARIAQLGELLSCARTN